MAQREGSVYLYLFIVACVLFMVTTVLFFIESSAKQNVVDNAATLARQKEQAENDVRQLNETIAKLHILVAGPSAATDPWQGDEHFKTLMKEKAERAINTVLTDLKEPTKSYESLVDCYSDIDAIFKKLMQARDEAFAKRQTAAESEVKVQADSAAILAELKATNATTLASLQELQTKYEDLDSKSKAEKADLVQKMDADNDLNTKAKIELSRQVNFKDNQIKALESRIDKLLEETRKEKDFEDIQPDGKIVNILSSSGKGWVNIGRADHLSNGLVFRVFQYMKGGKKVFKGRVEVQKVDETISEVRVIEEKDSLNPIVADDFISSPFYDPKAQPIFVFAGTEMKSKDVTKDYVIAKMKSYGAQVVDKVDINTNFLVALLNFENTPEYKAARELGVTVIREQDLLEFIGR